MKKNEKYSKVIEVLKGNKPTLDNKEELIDAVMQKIQWKSQRVTVYEKLSNYLFGWTDFVWIRGTMTIAATVFIGIFIIQQIVITDRINSLEKQLVKTVNTLQIQEPDLGIMQKILLKIVAKDQMAEDSVTISRSDLEELLNSYQELQEDYEKIKQDAGLEPYIRKVLRRNIQNNENDDESKL
ncbi:MAG: hypothetical protein JSV24_02730 [Bacteroidales bacterium]|nr:MAG: hypothetical protein JSV24_02730 [Bacteroidales bacterium]